MLLALALACVDATATSEVRVRDAVEVVVGDPTSAHAGCYRTGLGEVWCWGGSNLALNFVGPQPGPWKVDLPATPLKLASGRSGHCALLADGDVACWRGFNGHAEGVRLGLRDAVDLAMGQDHGCVATKRGRVQCWGANATGATGQTFGVSSPTPTEVPGLRDVVEVYAGGDASCARHQDGAVSCWGDSPFHPTPIAPKRLDLESRVLTLGRELGCVDRKDGRLTCFQRGVERELPAGRDAVSALAAGWGWACAVQAGQVRCWGRGPSPFVSQQAPAVRDPWTVEGIDDATGVSLFARYACASTRAGAVRCWGYNTLGELGDGTTVDSPSAATWLIHYAPTMLPEPQGGVFGCTADEGSRRSCLQAGVDCRLVPPPGAWYLPPSGVDRTDDRAYQEEVLAELSRQPVPACSCTCDADYQKALQAFQENMDRVCCPP